MLYSLNELIDEGSRSPVGFIQLGPALAVIQGRGVIVEGRRGPGGEPSRVESCFIARFKNGPIEALIEHRIIMEEIGFSI